MPLGAPGWEGGWLALLVLWGMVRGEVTASESRAEELLGVLGQLMTSVVAVLGVSPIPRITWCPGREVLSALT